MEAATNSLLPHRHTCPLLVKALRTAPATAFASVIPAPADALPLAAAGGASAPPLIQARSESTSPKMTAW